MFSWQQMQLELWHLWRKLLHDYNNPLLTRSKWRTNNYPLKFADLVWFWKTVPRGVQPMGQVELTNADSDNNVRSFKVKTAL